MPFAWTPAQFTAKQKAEAQKDNSILYNRIKSLRNVFDSHGQRIYSDKLIDFAASIVVRIFLEQMPEPSLRDTRDNIICFSWKSGDLFINEECELEYFYSENDNFLHATGVNTEMLLKEIKKDL